MKYSNKAQFEKVNMFGTGVPNEMFAQYFIGNSYLNFLTKPGESPIFMANVTFEPGCRNNWHIHQAKSGGGQILYCTAGEGWYQAEGKKPISLSEGAVVYIPTGVKHWHGAKADSWFSHISLEVPGEETNNEWLEPVVDKYYHSLPQIKLKEATHAIDFAAKITDKKAFKAINMFGTGMKNFMFSKYFSGRSYLKMLTMPGRTPIFSSNVTFEPACRNNWHIHHKGGQILICTAGTGWYQEEGKAAQALKPGDVVYIPAEVNHWHGATKDSWFSHIALNVPAEGGKVEWLNPVTDEEYNKLKYLN